MCSTYYILPIHSAILAEPIFSSSSIVRKSYVSTPYNNRFIMRTQPVSTGHWRSVAFTTLRDESNDVGIPSNGQQLCAQYKWGWVSEVHVQVFQYDQNVFIASIFFKLPNGLMFYHQPFHFPISDEHSRLDCNVE
jgi:hypothetical protein